MKSIAPDPLANDARYFAKAARTGLAKDQPPAPPPEPAQPDLDLYYGYYGGIPPSVMGCP